MRGSGLKHLLGKGRLRRKLSLQERYQAYRDLLWEFAAQTEPIPKISGKDEVCP